MNLTNFINFKNLLLIIITISFQNCYTFTGASIPPTARTVSVEYFPNRALLVQPTLSQQVTEKLKDRLISGTRLEMIGKDGDLSFQGEITGYGTQPVGIVAGEQAQMQRLTITIHVKFINVKDKKADFDQSFSRYLDYPSTKNLNEVEGDLIPQIVEKLTEDIFNKAVVNW